MIGVIYPDEYAVTETFQLLKIPWEWYDSSRDYDAVIADAKALESIPKNLIDLSTDDFFAQVSEMLNCGKHHNHEPTCEIILDRLRKRLQQFAPLVEIPPVPWGYSFIVAVTHDVDVMSTREQSWLSIGYAVYTCLRHGRIADALRIFLAKFGWGADPWNQFDHWMTLEQEMKIRSTFFFVPFKDRPGISSPGIRAVGYKLDRAVIESLLSGGWEIGVHGIDNWTNRAKGDEELRRFKEFGTSRVGTRVHWLLFGEETWKTLDEAGFYYDSTFGYNEDIGFRAGTLQVYRPRASKVLLELPLHIQDSALLGSFCELLSDCGWRRAPCLHLGEEEAKRRCDKIAAYAREYGGVVTVLWHPETIAPPRKWISLFRHLVSEAMESKAWVTRATDAVEWFRMRREARLTCVREGNIVAIRVSSLRFDVDIPLLVARLHVPGDVVESVGGEFVKHRNYVDIKCDKEQIAVVLR